MFSGLKSFKYFLEMLNVLRVKRAFFKEVIIVKGTGK